MDRWPRITVITPCFNGARYLERAMCSVLDQGYERLEYAVMDGGSCDSSTRIIRRYEDDLAWWVSMKDRGPAQAVNRALEYATGDVIAVLPCDDLYAPFALQRAAARMREPDAPQWLAGGWMAIDAADRPTHRAAGDAPRRLGDYLGAAAEALPLAASFFRAHVLRECGGFDATLGHQCGYELHCRLLARGVAPTPLPDLLALRRIHAESLTERNPEEARRERARVIDRYHGADAGPGGGRKRRAA